jgi:hypothetical protein
MLFFYLAKMTYGTGTLGTVPVLQNTARGWDFFSSLFEHKRACTDPKF